ncbi:hypothetical protein [Streptomyces sp. AS02]|uniref:hypothetical protein n=1 Tax=Streptomyces sp. AS02 TaxID=2938946 RepID=UPI00201FE5F0|nr:hypothetical protein [Streptomyces sp. AS02]MCL8015842.1 hypothetical protein [Streptomyces sp. AS02]
MKLTVFQFEGTPEELDASQVLNELTNPHRGSVTVISPALRVDSALPARIPGVADEGQETVRRLLSRSPAPGLFVRFLQEATGWDNVGVYGIKRKNAAPGSPLDYGRYLRLRKQGSQWGGFAYVYAESSSINLRLSHTAAELQQLCMTTARILTTGHPAYRVSVDLTDETSLADALRLAELAYNAT